MLKLKNAPSVHLLLLPTSAGPQIHTSPMTGFPLTTAQYSRSVSRPLVPSQHYEVSPGQQSIVPSPTAAKSAQQKPAPRPKGVIMGTHVTPMCSIMYTLVTRWIRLSLQSVEVSSLGFSLLNSSSLHSCTQHPVSLASIYTNCCFFLSCLTLSTNEERPKLRSRLLQFGKW